MVGFTVSQMDSYFKKAPNKTRGPLMEFLSRLCKEFTFNIVLLFSTIVLEYMLTNEQRTSPIRLFYTASNLKTGRLYLIVKFYTF